MPAQLSFNNNAWRGASASGRAGLFRPTTRLMVLALWAVFIGLNDSLSSLAWALAPVSLGLGLFGPPLHIWGKRLAVLLFMLLAGVMAIPILVPSLPGQVPLWDMGVVKVSQQGLRLALDIFLSASLVMLSVTTWLVSMGHGEVMQALSALRLPHKLVRLFALSLRTLDSLHHSWQRTQRSMAARGYRFALRWQNLQYVAQALAHSLIQANAHSTRLNQAMSARGYEGRWPSVHSQAWRAQDYALLIVQAGLIVGLWYAAP